MKRLAAEAGFLVLVGFSIVGAVILRTVEFAKDAIEDIKAGLNYW